MFFEKEMLPTIFSRKDFSRGQEYYRRGQIQKLKVARTDKGGEVTCVVKGSESYGVSVRVEGQETAVYCSCPRFADKHICKHIAAAMMACADLREEDLPAESDRWAKSMLHCQLREGPEALPRVGAV